MFKLGKKKEKKKKGPANARTGKKSKKKAAEKGQQRGFSKEEVNEKLDEGYLLCRSVVQMMGSPKDYLVKTLKQYIEKLKQERGQDKTIIVIKEEYARPKKQKELFTTFVELEMLVKNASELAFFCFDYMPTSIEIVDPEKFVYTGQDFSAFFNDMLARLHRVDMTIKTLTAENKNLKRNATLLLRNNVLISLTQKNKDIKELSKNTGIPESQLLPFLEKLIKEGWIKKEKEVYSLAKKL